MDADDILRALDRLGERRIQEAIDAGEFDNLQGEGKPLNLDDNPHVPEEMRAAFKVLQNSGFAPDWMLLGSEIETEIEKLRADADRHFRYLRDELHDLASDPYAVKRLGPELRRLRERHRRAARAHAARIEEINSKIRYFNHTVPVASLLKVPLSLQVEMHKYQDRLPAYLAYGQDQ